MTRDDWLKTIWFLSLVFGLILIGIGQVLIGLVLMIVFIGLSIGLKLGWIKKTSEESAPQAKTGEKTA